jgi:hypothetical protein
MVRVILGPLWVETFVFEFIAVFLCLQTLNRKRQKGGNSSIETERGTSRAFSSDKESINNEEESRNSSIA